MAPKDGFEAFDGAAARSQRWLLAGLFAYCAFLFFFRLGSRSISDADEVRDALTAHTMVATGDWWTPHFDGRPAFSKPPLFFWLTGALMKVVGPSRWSIRLAPAFSGMVCVGALVALGRRLYGPSAGLWAGFIAATTIPFVHEHGARTGVMDSLLLALLACGFLFLVWSLENPRWLLAAAAAMGLASLTKNLTGLLAAAAGAAFLFCGGRWRRYGLGRIAAAVAILLVLSFGWIAAMEAAHPLEFRRIFFGKELVQRAFQPEKFARRRSVPFLPGVFGFGQTAFRGFVPWSFLVPLAGAMALRRSRVERERDRLPILWLAVLGLTLLAVQVRFPWYAFLIDLPLALLVGRALAESFSDASPQAYPLAAASCVAAGFLFFVPNLRYDPVAADARVSTVRTVFWTPRPALSVAAACAVVAALAILFRRRPRGARALAAAAIVLVAGTLAAVPLRFSGSRSSLDRLFSVFRPGGGRVPGRLVLWRPAPSTFLFNHSLDWCLAELGSSPVREIRSSGELLPTLMDPSVQGWIVPESQVAIVESRPGVRELARADLEGVDYVSLAREDAGSVGAGRP